MNLTEFLHGLIDIVRLFSYSTKTHNYFAALVAQSVEHIVGNDEVSGPIPLGSLDLFY